MQSPISDEHCCSSEIFKRYTLRNKYPIFEGGVLNEG